MRSLQLLRAFHRATPRFSPAVSRVVGPSTTLQHTLKGVLPAFGCRFFSQQHGFLFCEVSPSGSIVLQTPLLSVPGVASIPLNQEDSVADLIAAVRSNDSSVSSVRVVNGQGEAFAKSTKIADFFHDEWSLQLDNLTVAAVSRGQASRRTVNPQRLRSGYDALRKTIVQSSHSKITKQEFVAMVRKSLADAVPEDDSHATVFSPSKLEEVAQRWLEYLHMEGLALHFAEASIPELKNIVFINPLSLKPALLEALDVDHENCQRLLAHCEKMLAEHRERLNSLDETDHDITTKATRQLKTVAYFLGIGALAQWGYIFNLVYEISWDFMEPVTYFVGTGYGILFYFFFMISRRDPTTGNIFQYFLKRKRNKLHRQFHPQWHDTESFLAYREATQKTVEKWEKAVERLRARLQPPEVLKAIDQ